MSRGASLATRTLSYPWFRRPESPWGLRRAAGSGTRLSPHPPWCLGGEGHPDSQA